MKAELNEQWKLLDLQKIDTQLTQINHKLANLPQTKELEAAKAVAEKASEEMVLAQTAVMDVEREITRVEGDIEQVRTRSKRNQARLDAGEGSAKDLTALQHELNTLARRQSVLEDEELEIMERLEGLRSRFDGFASASADAEARVKELKAQIAESSSELQSELAAVQAKRDEMAPRIQADLLAEYDSIRVRSGVAAAALYGRRCMGCGLELNPSDISRIKATAPDTVVYCEECGRILVRTADSGA